MTVTQEETYPLTDERADWLLSQLKAGRRAIEETQSENSIIIRKLSENKYGFRDQRPVLYNGRQAVVDYNTDQPVDFIAPLRVRILTADGKRPIYRLVKPADKLEPH